MDAKVVIERMKEALGFQNQTELGSFLGLSQGNISLAIRKNKIPADWFLKLSTGRGLNPNWLLTGVGPRFTDGEDTSAPLLAGDLGARIKQARDSFGFTQPELAEKIGGSSASAIGQYEKGEKIPGGKVLAGFARMGIDVNWLLTGQRETVDASLLRQIFDRVAASLCQRGLASFSSQASELVSLLYDEIASGLLSVEGIDARIERLVKIMSFPANRENISSDTGSAELAARLKIIRGALKQDEIAARLGVSKITVGRWERGERAVDHENLIAILRCFPEINPGWLLTGEGLKER